MPHLLLEVQNVNNRRFTEFFDRYFQITLPIVTKHELGHPFPPRNIPIKFGTNPSTIFLVIVVTDRQTHKQTDTQTNAGKNILPRFRGENKVFSDLKNKICEENLAVKPHVSKLGGKRFGKPQR